MYLKKAVLVGLFLYIVPNAVSFLIFRFFSWLVNPYHSVENAIYAYCIYIALIITSFIGGFIVARSRKKRSWGLRFFFAIITLIHFLPIIIILAPLGALIIFLQDRISKWVSKQLGIRILNSKIGCVVTSILASVSMFAGQLYIIEKGNVKTARNISKAVMVVHHLSSGDYFVAGILAMFRNWRVMIGENLWKYKIFHWYFNTVGIPIDREAGGALKRAKAVLQGRNFLLENKKAILIAFSRGTRERNPEKGVYGLKKGAIRIACELEHPIIPVVLVGTNKWRTPSEQDISSHTDKKPEYLKLFWDFLKQFFSTGINPTIAKVIYCNPISTVGKTVEVVIGEVEFVMNQTYLNNTRKKKRNRLK